MDGKGAIFAGGAGAQCGGDSGFTVAHLDFRQNLLLGDMPVRYIPGLRVQPQFQEKRQEGKVLIFKGNLDFCLLELFKP